MTFSRLSRFAFPALLAVSSLGSIGCGQSALVSSELPVRRVVIYRNGVAYFERGGTVHDDEVRFKMRDAEVGDFLGTLAVMEAGGSSVQSASFPIKVEDENEVAKPYYKMNAAEKRGLKDVVLHLDGKKHDLRVGYVAAAPVWRPSYRLLVAPGKSAQIQAWGVVENVSGEDWKDVSLTLVAGAPLAFESQLGTPTIPERPLVTDEGEVIAAVPKGETSLREEKPAEAPRPITPSKDAKNEASAYDRDADGLLEDESRDSAPGAGRRDARKPEPSKKRAGTAGSKTAQQGPMGGASANKAMPAAEAAGAPAPAPPPPPPVVPSGPRNLRSLAAIAQEGGTTRYDLPNTVTVPDKSATMVLLAAQPVTGEVSFLFATDGGVPDSASHPFRVARFANATKGTLERGPIAVFEGSSFVGQGMLDPLPSGAVATVPFALERGVAVVREARFEEYGERVAKIENGELTIERDSVQITKYQVKNGLDQNAKVLVKHSRMSGSRLEKPPAGTEDNLGTGSALVPVSARARGTSELVVDERTPVRRQVDWFAPIADQAYQNYKKSPAADRAVVTKLDAAWVLRADIVRALDARAKISAEEQNLRTQSEELRRNLRALEKNKAATQLRATITQRLGVMSSRLDVLTKDSVEIDTKLTELQIRFRDQIRDIKIAL